MNEANMNLAVSYLSPIDFMHTIETCKYLYSRYKDKVQEKRKESLVRFMERKIVENLYRIETWRGTKLPNGKEEGKSETFTEWHYIVQEYINGEPVGYKFIYNYIYCGNEEVLDRDKKLLRDDLSYKFNNWREIDTSGMRLLVRRKYGD